jgi:hypothetical protein
MPNPGRSPREKRVAVASGPPRRNQGLVEWLLACPEKGFFASIESDRTESVGLVSARPKNPHP